MHSICIFPNFEWKFNFEVSSVLWASRFHCSGFWFLVTDMGSNTIRQTWQKQQHDSCYSPIKNVAPSSKIYLFRTMLIMVPLEIALWLTAQETAPGIRSFISASRHGDNLLLGGLCKYGTEFSEYNGTSKRCHQYTCPFWLAFHQHLYEIKCHTYVAEYGAAGSPCLQVNTPYNIECTY